MKKFISLLILSFIFLNSFAKKVDITKAETVAQNFLTERMKSNNKIFLDYVLTEKSKSGDLLYYVFNLKNTTGFIIISADDNIRPVLAYSFESNYYTNDGKPDAFKDWIETTEKQINFILINKLKGTEKISGLWSYYSNPNFKETKSVKNVSPLLTTTWNQGCGYNSLCPETSTGGSCGHVWAGCVATAMAQVMNYHEHPVSGEGSHSYTHSVYGVQSADFENTVYDWANMPDGSGNAEVAKLMYHCGVSVNMNYGPSGSGAFSSTAANSLKQYFKYSKNLLLTSKYSYTEYNWAKLLRTEIDEGRPMYYHGYGSGGHAFNIDGYQGTDYFHLNWGWGGSYNGYYYLNDLTPGSHNYNNSQGAIIGVVDRDSFPGLDCSNPVVLTAGVPYNGTTVNSQNIVNHYGNCYYHSTGKEVVHQITTTLPGRLRATLTNLNDSILDVFILSDCNQDSLLAYGDTTAFADNTEPGTYFIVVDGRFAYEGNYTLTVTVPSNDPDLIITNQYVAPNKIEAGGIGQISFTEKNIGNSPANASKTNIYYSEDQTLDGSDILIDQIDIPALDTNTEYQVNQIITIPGRATEGVRYILFVADSENDVTETDEIYNIESNTFEVPPDGIMDCTGSVNLTDNVWYFGNTETDGAANIDNYPCSAPLPGKEVIHSLTTSYSGTATAEFTKKVPGQMNLIVSSSCNENTCLNSFAIWDPKDTLIHISFSVIAGVTYYFVVDAEEGISGAYGLKIKMPQACPEPYISSWGETDLCTGQGASLFTDWTYTDIQWYKDNAIIAGETLSYLWATETGEYKVKVTENGCSGFSDVIEVRVSEAPANADITAAGDTTFCEGNNVTLNLSTGNGYDIQWLKNGNPIEGETGISYIAEETGIYTAKVTNISCSINSNTKQITVNPVTANIGELARVNANDLVSWFSCDINDNTDLSGNGNDYFGAWTFPEDRNGNWNKATYYNGKWDTGSTSNSFDNPNVFTISLWMKTNTNSGGMIFGFGDNQQGASSQCDRMIYMDDDGKLYFGLLDGTAKTVSTTESYNDNNWHLLTASLSAGGMKLYVDGQLKAGDANVTNGANYTGWWKIAYDEIDPAFPNIPTSMYFRGVLDEIRIYERALLPEEVTYLFDENKIFTVAAEQTDFCESGATNIVLNNTENFIEYQLRNDADNSLVGTAVTGNAASIYLPTGTLTETTTFNILATNPGTGCSFELNNLFTININDLPTAVLSGGETVCPGSSSDITINFTGTAPWNFSYTDGTNTFNETTSDNPFTLTVSDAGTYQITALTDANCTGTDFSGTANIIVEDVTAPVPAVSSLPDITAECEVTSLTAPTANDNCAGIISGTYDISLPVTEQGTTTVTWTYDDGNGNTSTQTQNIIINDVTAPSITCPGNQNVNADDTHTYTVSGTGFDPLSVADNCNVASVVNNFNNSSSLDGAVFPEGTTNVIWTVTDDAGNQETCNFDILVNAYSVGINTTLENNFTIYPNPTSGILFLKGLPDEPAEIRISDLNGKIIKEFKSHSNIEEINIQNKPTGVYFIRINTKKGVIYFKILKRQ